MAQQKELMIDSLILQGILNHSFDAIFVTDTDSYITDVNSAAEKLFEKKRVDLIGKTNLEILGPQMLVEEGPALTEENGSAKHRTYYKRADGTLIPIDIAANPVLDDAKAIVATVYIVRDMREVAMLEETIHEKSRAMEMFIYSVSHDLRAPLRRIVNYAEILQEDHKGGLNPEVQRVIDRMAKNTAKMSELIDGLVSFSRLSQVVLQKTQIDMTALAAQVCDSQQKVANAPRVRFDIGNLPEVNADLNLVKLALGHLIANAIKFSQLSAEPLIQIRSTETADNITYFVHDNGVGFDMQYANKLFAIFQRLHNTTEFEGAGIGLAMVHQIISRHQGNVWAEGNVNQGATFYFSLPK